MRAIALPFQMRGAIMSWSPRATEGAEFTELFNTEVAEHTEKGLEAGGSRFARDGATSRRLCDLYV